MNHLQIYDNALPKESCRNIIKYFDNNPNVEKDLIMDAYGHIHSTRTWMDLSILGDVNDDQILNVLDIIKWKDSYRKD